MGVGVGSSGGGGFACGVRSWASGVLLLGLQTARPTCLVDSRPLGVIAMVVK